MDDQPSPRADLLAGLVWLVLGAVILQQSWSMDRLSQQGVEPWSAPGVVPGIIGGVLVLLALVMLARSLARRAVTPDSAAAADEPPAPPWRLAAALLLCALFVFGWLSLDLPFWLGAALFVTIAVLVFAAPSTQSLLRQVSFAVVFGLLAGVLIQLLFQNLFLVRLP